MRTRPRQTAAAWTAALPAVPGRDARAPVLSTQMLSQQVVDFLMGELVAGRIRQGDRINEAELARRLGISRNPIREAVKRLEERGLLISAPRRGTFVRRFSRRDIDDIFSFRVALEAFALQQALPGIGEADLEGLAELIAGMEAAADAGDEARLTALDLAFHHRICALSGNGQTLRAFASIQGEVQMLIALVDYGYESLHAAAADHWPVVEALRGRDPQRAEAALVEHIRDAWSRIAREYPEEETELSAAGNQKEPT